MRHAPAHAPTLKSDINVTPLVDIVLVLLIIFIVMVPGLTKVLEASIPQVTPPVAEATPRPTPLVLSLDGAGLRLQQDPLARTDLAARLVPVLLLQPLHQRKVFLKVEGEVPQSEVVAVMDQLRLASDLVKAQSRTAYGEEGMDTKVAVSLMK